MDVRKIGVIGGFVAGAALALAPLASADAASDSSDFLNSLVQGEIGMSNFLFGSEAGLAGVGAHVVHTAGSWDTLPAVDAPTGTPNLMDYLLYGVDPVKAGIAGDPGAYNLFNGSLVQFDNGINSAVYALFNNGATLDWTSGDLFGGGSAEHIATTATNGWDEAFNYFQFGLGDLTGYFGIF